MTLIDHTDTVWPYVVIVDNYSDLVSMRVWCQENISICTWVGQKFWFKTVEDRMRFVLTWG